MSSDDWVSERYWVIPAVSGRLRVGTLAGGKLPSAFILAGCLSYLSLDSPAAVLSLLSVNE